MKIKEVAQKVGLSVKTLQHFDSINLLSPKRSYNGYREYDEDDITRLKSILFFRELDFPLKEIAKILDCENFDRNQVLADQIKLLKIKRDRINSIIELAEREIGDNNMEIDLDAFNNEEFKSYEKEVKQRWGKSDAYKESKKNLEGQTAEDIKKTGDALMNIFTKFGAMKDGDVADALYLVEELKNFITDNYYSCDDYALQSLGYMYVSDDRFKANIDKKGGDGTAEFVNRCIEGYLNK